MLPHSKTTVATRANSRRFQSFANENENLSKVCQTFCLRKQNDQQACQTCQTCQTCHFLGCVPEHLKRKVSYFSFQVAWISDYRFRDLGVNQIQIPSLPNLSFSDFDPNQTFSHYEDYIRQDRAVPLAMIHRVCS